MLYFKRFLHIMIFLIGLILILQILSTIFSPKDNVSGIGMEEVKANGILGENKNTIDVVVIGDSESISSISPMEIWNNTGYTTYVSGSSGQPLNYSLKMLQRAFENQKPKIVILETNTIFRNVSLQHIPLAQFTETFSIFDYNDRWKKLRLTDLFKPKSYSYTDDTKGYVFSSLISPSTTTNHMEPTNDIKKISRVNRYLIDQIKELSEANGAKFLLLSTPSTVNWNYPRHNAVKKLAEELDNEYIDLNLMNDEINIDWSKDTRDRGDHLNHNGAVKVSNYLSEYLAKTKILSDHRNDKKYDNWHKSYQRYINQIYGT
ncbi:hypothetical protein MKL26_02765 [Streptococcus suis]|nr:hypothetical protein [Streptococcus suis]